MPLKVTCGDCGADYNLAESMAGKKVRCRECSGTIEIPSAKPMASMKSATPTKPRSKPVAKKLVNDDEFIDDDDLLEDEDDLPRRPVNRPGSRRGKSKKSESSGAVLAFSLAAAAVMVLIGAIYGIVTMVRGGGGQQPVAVNAPGVPDPGAPTIVTQPPMQQPMPEVNPNAGTVNPIAPPATNNNPPVNVPSQNNNVPPSTPAPVTPPSQPVGIPESNPVPASPFVTPNQPALPSVGGVPAKSEVIVGFPVSPAGVKKPAGWIVTADPGPTAEKFDSRKPPNVRIGTKPWQNEAIFPTHLSPYAAVGEDSKEIWDLRTDERIGFVTGLKSIKHFALSTDGKTLVTNLSKDIKVFDTKTGKVLKEAQSPDGNLTSFEFAGPKRLVGLTFFGEVIAWSAETLDVQFKTKLVSGASNQSLAISPGGKFLAVFAGGNKLVVGDLDSGKPAGELVMGSVWDNNASPSVLAMEFSPDGQELAALFDVPGAKGSNLVVWDVGSARTISSLTFTGQLSNQVKRSSAYEKPIIQWFPDRSKFLVYGAGVVDRASGGLVWQVPNDNKLDRDGPRRVLSDSLIAVVGGERSNRSLTTVEVPLEELRRGAEMIAAGGLAIDAKLPPITKADVSGAKPLDVAVAGEWRMVAETIPAKPALLAQAIAIPFDGMVVQGTKHSAGAVTKMAVLETSAGVLQNGTMVEHVLPHLRTLSGKRDAVGPAAARLTLHDVASGQVSKTTLIENASELMSLSPSGARVLLRLAEGQDRLDVWNAESGQHERGWRPYLKEERGQIPQQNKQAIDFAEFAGEDRVVTLNRIGRKLTIWKLPECRAEFTVDNVSLPLVAPDGKTVAVVFAQTVNLFDVATGAKVGTVLLDGTPQGMSFSPDGGRLAVSYFAPGSPMLAVVDLKTGQLTTDFPVPSFANRMHWCGAEHVLIGDASLIDLKREMVIGSYSLPHFSQHLPDSPDGRHWYVTPRAPNDMTMILTASALPEPQLVQLVQQRNPKRETVLHPGASVALQINVFEPPTSQGFSGAVKQRLMDGFSKHQITVADGAPLVISVSMTERATGQNDEYRSIGFGAGRGTTTVAVKEVACTVTYTQAGVKLAESTQKFTNRGGFIEHLREGETIEQHVNKRMYESATNHLLNSPVPKYVFPTTAIFGLSRGQFEATGIKPVATPVAPSSPNTRIPGLRT